MTSYTYELIELGDDAHGLGCKCCRFSNGTDLPMPNKTLTKADVQHHAKIFATSIFKDWTLLTAIIKRFESTIQKRWIRKSIRQRREILLRVCPEMPTCHRPDFAGFRKPFNHAPRSRTCRSRAYLWPYINLEDLQQEIPLMLFLSSRGRHLPEKFVDADIDNAHLGLGWEFDACPNSDSMVFYSARSPSAYGEVIGLLEGLEKYAAPEAPSYPGDVSPAMRLVSRYHPQLGLLGLEIQASIYGFLRDVAKTILHDIEPADFTLVACQPPWPLPTSRRQDHEYASLQAQMLEAPYRLPQGFDLERIRAMVGSRRSLAADHVWALREDPQYFIDALKEWKEHDNRNYNCSSCGDCYKEVAAEMINDALSYFLFWHNIHTRLEKLPNIDEQIAKADYEQIRLRRPEEKLWAELEEIMHIMIVMPICRISNGLPVAPRLRQHYPNGGDLDATRNRRWFFVSKGSEAAGRVDNLFHAFIDEDQRALHQLGPLVQEAQYMIETDPAAAQLLDPWILSQFADLALIAELTERMQRFKPWCDSWRVCVGRSQSVVESVGKLLRLDTQLMGLITDACKHNTMLPETSAACWRYPADKRTTKENVQQMRHAEKHLDMFWEELEADIKAADGADLKRILHHRGLGDRVLFRTPEWKEPVSVKPAQKGSPDPFMDAKFLEHAVDSTERFTAAKERPKVKTRGLPASVPKPEDAVPMATAAEISTWTAAKPTVTVSKRAYRVFTALLPHPTAEQHQRTEIAWDDLLHAMNSIGMRPEKLYGSVWSFKPMSDAQCAVDVTRGIQFHEPKEVRRGNKIGSHMVRVLGRRLKHAYGWEAGMFVMA